MTRPLFNPHAKCPKCWSPHVTTKHVDFAYICLGDALRRTCQRCGYVWDEQPLDVSRRA